MKSSSSKRPHRVGNGPEYNAALVNRGDLTIWVDEATGELAAAAVSTNEVGDSELLPDVLDAVDDAITQVSGDGAYDSHRCYDAIADRGANGDDSAPWSARDENILRFAINGNIFPVRVYATKPLVAVDHQQYGGLVGLMRAEQPARPS